MARNSQTQEMLPIKTSRESYGITDQELAPGPTGGPSSSRPWMKRRHVVASLAFLGFCIIYMLRVNLSVAIVDMTSAKVHSLPNGTTVTTPPDFDWDSKTQGIILGSFFYGYIVTQLPGGFLATKFGGKNIFLIGIACTAVLTLLTPALTYAGTGYLITTRILEGLFEGITYPSIHAIWARWAPPLERSKLAAVAFSGSYVGTVIALPMSGLLAQNCGWPYIFYVCGSLGLVWCFLWWWIVRDSPEDDAYITEQELEYLRTTIGAISGHENLSLVPWGAMIKSQPVWAIIIAHFAENWGFYTLLTGLPMFMRDILHYKLDAAGFLAALPYLLMAGIVQSAGILADLARTKARLSTTTVRKLFTCGSYISQTCFMTLTALMLKSQSGAIICISLSLGCGGFAWAGFSVNHLDIAPQFAAILMGVSNTIGTIPGIISPAVTGFIVQDKLPQEWQTVFLITAGLYLTGAVFYALMASGERQPWAIMDVEQQEQSNSETKIDESVGRQSLDYDDSAGQQ